jgi:low temperature requirement protein LtrA
MVHKIWRPPRLHQVSSLEEERKVTWLELFYDLVYVATLIQLGNVLSEEVTLAGFGQFAIVFVPIWWAWTGVTFYMNRFVVDDIWHRLLIFGQMCAIAWLGVSVEGAFGELAGQFALAYAAIRLVLVLLYLRTWRHAPATKPLTRRYVAAHLSGIVLWFVSAFLPAPVNYILWLAALGIEIGHVFLPKTRQLQMLLPPDPHHMIERYGIFTIIVLGESFIKTITAASGSVINVEALLFSLFGIGIVFGLWWLYYNDSEESSLKPAHWAPYVWIYAHLPLTIGLTAFGVASKKLFLSVGEDQLKYSYILLYCAALILVGLALFLINHATTRPGSSVTPGRRGLWRMGMVFAFALLALFGSQLSALTFVILAAAILAVQITADVWPGPGQPQPPTTESAQP